MIAQIFFHNTTRSSTTLGYCDAQQMRAFVLFCPVAFFYRRKSLLRDLDLLQRGGRSAPIASANLSGTRILKPILDRLWRHCETAGVRGRTLTLKVKYEDADQFVGVSEAVEAAERISDDVNVGLERDLDVDIR
jgi:hypothetical protein